MSPLDRLRHLIPFNLPKQQSPPPKDRLNQPVTFFKERVDALVKSLDMSGDIIGVPTPALAEVLVKSGPQRALFVNILNDHFRFQLVPFGVRAAIQAAELIDLVKADTKGVKVETWAKVKFDAQIVAIAKAESVDTIYSDDIGLERLAKRVGLRVIRVCDLPVPQLVVTNVAASLPRAPGTQLPLLPGLSDDQIPSESSEDLGSTDAGSEVPGSSVNSAIASVEADTALLMLTKVDVETAPAPELSSSMPSQVGAADTAQRPLGNGEQSAERR